MNIRRARIATGLVLFTYLIILNLGLLSLAFFKRWFLINVLALFFTELIFGGWLIALMVWLMPASEGAKLWLIIILTWLLAVNAQ